MATLLNFSKGSLSTRRVLRRRRFEKNLTAILLACVADELNPYTGV